MSARTENFQRRALRRNRLIATALLGAMAALFISTTVVPQPGFWILLVRATAEAAVVGALADWFAITALFRRPVRTADPAHCDRTEKQGPNWRGVGHFHRAQFSDTRTDQGEAAFD